MLRKSFVFDLDGTISNPQEGICEGFRYALGKMGVEAESTFDYAVCIGAPLKDSMQKYFFQTEMHINEAISHFREYYADKGMYQNHLYDGIAALLKKLHVNGHDLHIATNKPEKFAVQILDYFCVSQYFKSIRGAHISNHAITKDDLLKEIINANKSENEILALVGDTIYDIKAAQANNLDCVAVTYGFGCRHELEAEGAKHIAHSIAGLEKILLNYEC